MCVQRRSLTPSLGTIFGSHEGDVLQIWKVDWKILNTQSRAGDR